MKHNNEDLIMHLELCCDFFRSVKGRFEKEMFLKTKKHIKLLKENANPERAVQSGSGVGNEQIY